MQQQTGERKSINFVFTARSDHSHEQVVLEEPGRAADAPPFAHHHYIHSPDADKSRESENPFIISLAQNTLIASG